VVSSDLTPRYLRLPSRALGRSVHMWQYGHHGPPVIAFPTSGGYAHEWQQNGMVDALSDLIRAGRLKVYQPETNVSRTWTGDGPVDERLSLHAAYERFVVDELVPHIEADCGTPGIEVGLVGASVGALYAVNLALKHPKRFRRALGLSGRYATRAFIGEYQGLDAYYSTPLDYVWNLHGEELERIRANTHLTLVVGRGAFEGRCIGETAALARAFRAVGVPHHHDEWGRDVAHTWSWWHRQARYHLPRLVA
jgi:esterase/lipase superfamily enzyme